MRKILNSLSLASCAGLLAYLAFRQKEEKIKTENVKEVLTKILEEIKKNKVDKEEGNLLILDSIGRKLDELETGIRSIDIDDIRAKTRVERSMIEFANLLISKRNDIESIPQIIDEQLQKLEQFSREGSSFVL